MTDNLISQQAAVDALARVAREKFNLSDEFNHYLAGLMDGEKAVRDLPEAVIRCRDCRYYEWMSNRVPAEQTWFCHNWNAETGKNDYCSYAERREQDDR